MPGGGAAQRVSEAEHGLGLSQQAVLVKVSKVTDNVRFADGRMASEMMLVKARGAGKGAPRAAREVEDATVVDEIKGVQAQKAGKGGIKGRLELWEEGVEQFLGIGWILGRALQDVLPGQEVALLKKAEG